MNFWEILILFFSFQALVLGLLFLIRKTGDRIANIILAIFLFLFAYNLFFNVLYWSRFNSSLFAFLSYTYLIPISLYGPLFFVYIRRVTTAQSFTFKDVIHLIPFFSLMYQFGPFYILPLNQKITLLTGPMAQGDANFFLWGAPIMVLIMFGYGLFSYFRFIHRYKNDPELTIWLKVISAVFISFTISHIVYRALVISRLITFEFDYFITIFMVLLIASVCYFAFVHSSVFNGTPIKRLIPFVKYEKTGLSHEFSLEMKEKLLFIMAEERPFLNPDVRLDTIAKLLDVSRHHASQIINEHFSVNFFDFINKYRIKEAQRLLTAAEPTLSITDIAFQSGFNNRISFYKAFKKILGTTPSDYREHTLAS